MYKMKIFSMMYTRAVVIQTNYNIFEYLALHAKLNHILGIQPFFGKARIVKNSESFSFLLDYVCGD